MKKKTLGIILISIGSFFFIDCVFGMISLHILLIGFSVPFRPLEYWGRWLILGGWSVLIVAGLGSYLIFRGYNCIKQGQISES
ncbi:MAG: hypothetical protein EU533_02635 [Promethearchaeota archaeon]|nr:MAG: hypothetical protein EU533_02635 [Candidatus Lokiarchaeota archaeon]